MRLSRDSVIDETLAEWLVHGSRLAVKPQRLYFQVSEEVAAGNSSSPKSADGWPRPEFSLPSITCARDTTQAQLLHTYRCSS